ncbi:hypothetical protein HK097_009790 [Rhizophlyctis rosea]|uniref:AAA+ ATPase domain-containing protein n=1 Tax=Rhizophlyctis rosea TaxID=64517 RepID=A0AAD5SA12_9FUNG|nr:hypothetical protein HK097_009790 [Rhizophlyctis rosea]
MESFVLASALPEDTSSTKARIPAQEFAARRLAIDQWGHLITKNAVYHCRIWPHTQNQSSYSFCQVDDYIARPLAPSEFGVASELGDGRCALRAASARPPILTSLAVFVTVQHNDAQFDELGFVYTGATAETKRQVVRGILMGLLLRTGCTVGERSTGCLSIKILHTEPQSTDAIFTSQTSLILSSTPEITPPISKPISTLDSGFQKLSFADSSSPSPATLPLKAEQPIPGLEKAYASLLEVVTYPLLHSELVAKMGIEVPKGVLLHGPPGVGKTLLVSTIARACGAKMFTIHGPEVYGAYIGESERQLRDKFAEAREVAAKENCPCILFIDELDALTPHRTTSQQHESRVVAQLLTLMDGISSRGRLIVIGATNRPNAIDPALRRPGRFDREVAIDVPSEEARVVILNGVLKGMPVGEDVDVGRLARATNGYVGADLAALCREAALHAVGNWRGGESPTIPSASFAHALHTTSPSTLRTTSISVDRVTWSDIGGLDEVKQKLQQAVEWPIIHRDTFARLGLAAPRGVLLYGPPGCSKTTLVKVIASTSGASFHSVNGAALYSPFVGDSEREIRTTFARARASAPSIIFFDEVDAIVGKRSLEKASGGGSGGRGGDSVQERVLSALLNEMDGIEAARGVLVVGATNRPDMIDAALMRPGRFDRILYVPPPSQEARHQILKIYTKSMPVSPDVDLKIISGERTNRYTGADLKAVCREAAMEALRESMGVGVVQRKHFDAALKAVTPTLSDEMLKQYEDFEKRFGSRTKG